MGHFHDCVDFMDVFMGDNTLKGRLSQGSIQEFLKGRGGGGVFEKADP